MRSDEFNEPPERSRYRGRRFELLYWEREGEGDRYHLRFTGLALLLVVCLTVIPTAAICALYLVESRAQTEEFNNLNLNFRVEPHAPAN